MINLPNNCRCSKPSIFPKNWKTGPKALLNVDWYICYGFYDDNRKDHPKYGKPIFIKAGINRYKTLEERREAVPKDMIKRLYKVKGIVRGY